MRFEKTVLELKEGHTWRCKPGYKIFVLGQGALRFDVPRDWVMQPEERSVSSSISSRRTIIAASKSLCCATHKSIGPACLSIN
jgi:hypothetical protein